MSNVEMQLRRGDDKLNILHRNTVETRGRRQEAIHRPRILRLQAEETKLLDQDCSNMKI